jgi:2-polyprenyl-3-methyl-5-hydroxy-6-metoxy-1,4-benzoquinol methylase
MVQRPVEETHLESGRFAAAACMSVIEHGVETPRFFAEVRRLLRPGGLLILSTDYWPQKLEIGGAKRFRQAHGPDRIFDDREIAELCSQAQGQGLLLADECDLTTARPVIRTDDLAYTFLVLGLRKKRTA